MAHVSVVIPVFNSAPLVGTAVRSVFGQTFRDFEVIVVDDGSEDQDALRAALAEWSDAIHYIRQPNGGPAKARNTGIERATGELIAFLDADDEWLPDKLEKQVEYFRRYPETGLLHTGVLDDERTGNPASGAPIDAFCDLFHTTFFVNTLTVMIPRRVLDEVGGFDERREVHVEDWDLWLRIAARHPFGYLPEPLAFHRPGGLMSRQVERTYAAQALVIEKSKPLCQAACALHRAAPAACEQRRLHVLYRDWGCDRLQAGDHRGARERLRRALALAPRDANTIRLYLSTFVDGRWRRRARRVISKPRNRQAAARAIPSLVHDTVYRGLRRRVIGRLHDLEDAAWRMGRSRKRVLFDAASPMSFALFQPIYNRLRQDPRVEVWFTASGDAWRPQEIFAQVGITENVVPASSAAWMKVDVYVNADFWDMTWLHRRTRRVHLFHGVAGKYGLDAPCDLAPAIAAFDALMFVNKDRRRRYVEAGLVPDEAVKAALVGYPKIDCLVDGSLDRSRIARELGLDPSVPAVIYAPTWSPYSSLNVMGEEIIERLSAEGLQVIVKLHDRSYDRRQRGSGGIDWGRRLSRYDSHPLVRVVRQPDASPFLTVSDAMVSDHSSIAFEYMLLDRPIVVVDRPDLIVQAGISPDKVQRLRSAARVVGGAEGAARAIVEALQAPERLSAERRRVAADLFHLPGTATDRALAILYRMIELPAPAGAAAALESDRTVAALG